MGKSKIKISTHRSALSVFHLLPYALVSKTGVNSQNNIRSRQNLAIGWESTFVAVYQQNSLHFLEVKAISKTPKRVVFYSHSIVAEGLGDIS